jgi:ATP-dependent DNA ligase
VPHLAFDRGFIASQRPDLAWLARRHVDSAEGEQWIRGNAAIRWCDAGQMANAQASLDDWLEPELATLTRDRFFSPDWIYERKFDGERCLAYHSAGSVRLMTRNRQNVNGTYPEIADALLGLRERKKILRPLLSYGGAVRFTVHRTRDGQAYWDHAQRSGWEGLVVKRADSPYTGGRSRDWLKFKAENSQEFVIGGFTDPQGSRSGFGALLIGYYDEAGKLAYAGKVGTGFDQETLANLHATLAGLTQPQTSFSSGARPRTGAHWVRPVLVCQVGFSEWTTAGQLRHPRYLGLRRDKDPGSVTRERPE